MYFVILVKKKGNDAGNNGLIIPGDGNMEKSTIPTMLMSLFGTVTH
jgi:hypothetical protein